MTVGLTGALSWTYQGPEEHEARLLLARPPSSPSNPAGRRRRRRRRRCLRLSWLLYRVGRSGGGWVSQAHMNPKDRLDPTAFFDPRTGDLGAPTTGLGADEEEEDRGRSSNIDGCACCCGPPPPPPARAAALAAALAWAWNRCPSPLWPPATSRLRTLLPATAAIGYARNACNRQRGVSIERGQLHIDRNPGPRSRLDSATDGAWALVDVSPPPPVASQHTGLRLVVVGRGSRRKSNESLLLGTSGLSTRPLSL